MQSRKTCKILALQDVYNWIMSKDNTAVSTEIFAKSKRFAFRKFYLFSFMCEIFAKETSQGTLIP